jgi:anti-anti-sigma regulatory factor
MTMTMIPVWTEIDGERAVDILQETREKLNGDAGDVFLDFSSVRRIDPTALRAMEALARRADEKAVRVVLRGVNVDVYRVLKLVKLSPRFSFVA